MFLSRWLRGESDLRGPTGPLSQAGQVSGCHLTLCQEAAERAAPSRSPLQSPQHPSSVPPLLTKHFAWQPQELRSGVGLLGPEPQHHQLYGLGQTALCPHASVSPHAKCGGNNGPYARGTGQSMPMPPKPSMLPLARARSTVPQWPPGPTRWPSVQACSAPATRASWLLLSLSKP